MLRVHLLTKLHKQARVQRVCFDVVNKFNDITEFTNDMAPSPVVLVVMVVFVCLFVSVAVCVGLCLCIFGY